MPTWTPPADAHVTYSQQHRRCGKAACAACANGGPGHGPYWYAYWRADGRLCSRYLGKQVPPGAFVPEAHDAGHDVAAPTSAPTAGVSRVLRVRTLGGFAVWRGEQLVPAASWNRRKVLALFTFLISAPEHRARREQVAESLWPEEEPSSAMRKLHDAAHLLRKILDGPVPARTMVRASGDLLVLDPAAGEMLPSDWLDAATFMRAATAALAGTERTACRSALALYAGDYLPDEPYAEWVVTRRESLSALHLALLLHLARLDGAAGDLEGAERCLRAVLAIDSCSEQAALALMRVLAAQGERAAALRVYQVLATALETELGLAPGAEIEAVRASLLLLEAAPTPADLLPRSPLPPQVGNLPAQLTSFVGRDWERREVIALLSGPADHDEARCRLLTLTGPGGCGKTRLATEVGRGLVQAYPDGVWLVELAALADAGLVPRAVAAVLGIQERTKDASGSALIAALIAFLQPRNILLLLDNCEHLLAGCADLVTVLLRGCPGLCVLATSREAIGVDGETSWRVPPLATPQGITVLPLDALLQVEAVRLFVDRARASRPGFALSEHNAHAVVQVCRRLDGLPLAIELAAARLGTLSLESVVTHLDDCFQLLSRGSRAALPRQQTLRATMDWSYSLLTGPERCLFRRLSVFVGGWTLEAAEVVCGVEGPLARSIPCPQVPDTSMLDLLAQLTAQSLVQTIEQGRTTRYRLLETVRQYAREQLLTHDEAAIFLERHRSWFLRLLARAGEGMRTAERGTWLDRLDDDLDNLRLALTSSMARADQREAILGLAEPLCRFCLERGYQEEGHRWLVLALADGCGGATAARAHALNAAGTLANERGEHRQAMALYAEGLALFRALGDRRGSARVLINQGTLLKFQGEREQARTLYEAGHAIVQELDDRPLLALALNNLGTLAIEQGDHTRATAALEQSLLLKRQVGNQDSIVHALINLGEVARWLGDSARATSLFEEALARAGAVGARAYVALVHYNLGLVARAQGDHRGAAAEFQQSVILEHELGNRRQIAANLEGLAGLAVARKQRERAGRLFGAAGALRQRIDTPLTPADRIQHGRDRDLLHAGVDEAVVSAAWSAGEALTLDEIIALATDTSPGL